MLHLNDAIKNKNVLQRQPPWFKSPKYIADSVFPSLIADFENGRYVSGDAVKTFDEMFNFSRGSVGRYKDVDGLIKEAAQDVPRFDYSTGKKTLLREEQRINLVTYSETLSYFVASSVNVSDNYGVSPDGEQNASLCSAFGTNSFIRSSFTPATTNEHQASLWVKGNGTPATISILIFRLSPFKQIEELVFTTTDEWVRLELPFTPADTSQHTIFIGGNSTFSTGEELLAWGVQVEEGPNVTSYIKTNGAAVTRYRDNISIKSEIASEWYNQTKGTFVIDMAFNGSVHPTPDVLRLSGATGYLELFLLASTHKPYLKSYDGGATQAHFFSSEPDGAFVFAAAYEEDNFAISTDGASPATDISGTVTNDVSGFVVGESGSNSQEINMNLSSLSYYEERISNDTLRILSSKHLDFIMDGDSYSSGLSSSLDGLDDIKVINTGVGGDTLASIASRVDGLTLLGEVTLVIMDGAVNGHGTVAEDIAKYQQIYNSARGNVIFVSPCVYPSSSTDTETHTVALTAEMIIVFGSEKVVDATALTIAMAGTSDKSDPAYTALFTDTVHPVTALYDAFATAVLDLV